MKLAIVEKKNFLAGLQCTLTSSCAIKGGPFDFKKFPKNFFENVIFEQCHSAETNEGGTLWCNPKKFKKSYIVPKKSGAKVGSLVCFRGSGRVLFFSFRFGCASEVRVF